MPTLNQLMTTHSFELGTRENPLHRGACSPTIPWTTTNCGEAIPGVTTPLTWSFFADAQERSMKGTFYDMGVLKRSEVFASLKPEERLMDIFYGRASANINSFRYIGDRTPGTSGDAIEEQIFGQVRPGVTSRKIYSRYLFVALRFPWSALRLTSKLHAATDDIYQWWQRNVRPGALASREAAQTTLREAAARFELVMRPHTLDAMLCQALYDQLKRLAAKAGKPGLELTLITGYGEMSETTVVSDLWEVAKGRLEFDEFIRRHGFHGPSEGDLASRVWRIDPTPVKALLGSYKEMDEERDPRRIEHERGLKREQAEQELLAALPWHRRAHARLVIKVASRFVPMRGTGKAGFLRCIDVGRAAARAIGEDWVRNGLLKDVEDVFLFTVPELIREQPPEKTLQVSAERRAQREEYLKLDIPVFFEGMPKAFPLAGAAERDDSVRQAIKGAPVCAGIVTGLARLIIDPQLDDPLEPGEILVCRTTDPSWAATMMVASALVIDIGGPISHGAIVARELGIPCVIGTGDGTARIRTGDMLRVDGQTGEVTVLENVERAAA